MTTEALSAPESRSGAVPGPTTRPNGDGASAANLDGKTRAAESTRCAPDGSKMRDWCPSWAVMGPSTTATELAQAKLDGHIEEDT